jgi:hypothetical protein
MEVIWLLTVVFGIVFFVAQMRLFAVVRELREINATLDAHTGMLAHIANSSPNPTGVITGDSRSVTESGPHSGASM